MKLDFFRNQAELDRMRFDPDNYKWGIFYYNPKDSRIILPKRNFYFGLTFNFGNPWTYAVIATGIVIGTYISEYL